MSDDCIFCKIVRGEIPSRKVYEDDEVLADLEATVWPGLSKIAYPKTEHAAEVRLLDSIITRWPAAQLTSHVLPYGDDLTIDWISADPLQAKDRLIVVTTAEHGIEGYFSSAELELFCDEYLPRLDPQTTGLLLVHAINPWGMKHWKRTNPNNVDLNRNFVSGDFAALTKTNPDYPKMVSYLSPQRKLENLGLEKLRFFGQTLHKLVAFGPSRVREAALMSSTAAGSLSINKDL